MKISWGYSPKVEKYIPLGDFPADKYLIIVKQVVENLGWKLSHISANGLIAYTPVSLQSYSEEISVRITANFAIIKSECIGIQLWFNDYGKNNANLDKFFHEFEYVEFHLKDIWEESITKFNDFIATQDPDYFEKAPLTAKNKIKNILYLFFPQKGYLVTPILVIANVIYYLLVTLFIGVALRLFHDQDKATAFFYNLESYIGAANRELILEGQYWRLLSYQFIHWSFTHIFFNMYALIYIGLMIEHKIGVKKYLLIYIFSGICGCLCSIIFHDLSFIGGASASIMGLFGAFLALLFSNAFERNANKALLISTLLVVTIMLLNGLRGNTDNIGHIGGLVSGFFGCLILCNEKIFDFKPNLRYGLFSAIMIGFSIIILAFTPNYQPKKFFELEEEFKRNTAPYVNIYSISNALPTNEKQKLINKYGVELWKQNKLIVGKMKKLKLNEKHSEVRKHYEQITNKTLQFVKFLYLEAEDEKPRYKKELDSIMREINIAKEIANESGERYWAY